MTAAHGQLKLFVLELMQAEPWLLSFSVLLPSVNDICACSFDEWYSHLTESGIYYYLYNDDDNNKIYICMYIFIIIHIIILNSLSALHHER